MKVTASTYPSLVAENVISLTNVNFPSWRTKIQPLLVLSPYLLVVFLGVFAVCDIMWVVLTFNDCKEAAAEIDVQVAEAKKEMKRRKIGLKK